MSHPDWLCHDCKDCTLCIEEYYMVHDSMWERHGVDLDMLCIGCLEKRIGRILKKTDFTKYPVNTDLTMRRSSRLRTRLGQ
jgi:hypothetical protein